MSLLKPTKLELEKMSEATAWSAYFQLREAANVYHDLWRQRYIQRTLEEIKGSEDIAGPFPGTEKKENPND